MRFRASAIAFACILLLAGCAPQLVAGGEDSSYLKDLTTAPSDVTSAKLFPLAVGNYWDMNAISETKRYRHKVVADSVKLIGKRSGIHLNYLRDGVLWRQEVYQNNGDGLYLLAYGEKKPDLLALDPPVQLMKSDVVEGAELPWKGFVRFQGKSYPATAYSRVSSLDTLTTRKGRFQAYRIDSVISMTRPGQKPLHFPSIRWLSKGIGLVRRSYADDGKPALEELDQYMVSGG